MPKDGYRIGLELPDSLLRLEPRLGKVGGFESIGDAAARVVEALTVGGGDKPAFEVVYGAHRYQIWADGRIEGFPPRSVAINCIPEIVAEAVEEAVDEAVNFHDIPGEDN